VELTASDEGIPTEGMAHSRTSLDRLIQEMMLMIQVSWRRSSQIRQND